MGSMGMKFYKNLYIGDTVKKPHKIMKKLKKDKILPSIYVIVCMEGKRQLEIYHSLMLQQWYYKEASPAVIGIAGSKEEAFDLIQKVAQEAVDTTGAADLTAYLALDDRNNFK